MSNYLIKHVLDPALKKIINRAGFSIRRHPPAMLRLISEKTNSYVPEYSLHERDYMMNSRLIT